MTYYLRESQALFQHIPRTGGHWVQRIVNHVLGLKGSIYSWNRRPQWVAKRHTLYPHYYKRRASQISLCFSFVRHPMGLYSSTWRYLNNKGGFDHLERCCERQWHPMEIPLRHWRTDFGDFLKSIRDSEGCYVTRLYEWFCGPERGEFCGFIGRTENIAEDTMQVLTIIGHGDLVESRREAIQTQAPYVGKSKGVGDVIWSDKLEHLVCDMEHVTIKRFYGEETQHRRMYAELAQGRFNRIQIKKLWGLEPPRWVREL